MKTMPFMALRRKFCENIVQEFMLHRCYSSKVDLKKLRPMILKRIQNRTNNCPIKGLIPVAQQVFEARAMLIHGVSTLLKAFPVVSCKSVSLEQTIFNFSFLCYDFTLFRFLLLSFYPKLHVP